MSSPAVWSPFATPAEVTYPLACSGGAATVTLRPWTALERIAYEDAVGTSLLTVDEAGGQTVRMGRMGALLVTSTIRSWTGFPDTLTRGGQVESLDLRKREHLELLDPGVYAELVALARKVQPLPGSENDTSTGGAAGGAEGGEDAEDEGVDPSRTPSTPPAVKRPTDRARATAR